MEIDGEGKKVTDRDKQTPVNAHTCMVSNGGGGTAAAGYMNLILLFFHDRPNPN